MGKVGEGQFYCLVLFIDCFVLSKVVVICLFSINIFFGLILLVIFYEELKYVWLCLIVFLCLFFMGCVEIKKKSVKDLKYF